MGWLLSIVVAILTGAAGMLAAGFVASACVRWYRISSFEGGSGYFVVALALVGAIAGIVVGLIVARVVAGGDSPGFLKALGVSLVLVGVVAGGAAATAFMLADVPPELDGRRLRLEVELRLPVGEAVPKGEAYVELGSVEGGTRRRAVRGSLELDAARQEGGRWIVPGVAELFTQRGKRGLSIHLGGADRDGFLVPLPARPGAEYLQWSEWGPRPPAGSPPWPDSKMSYRFRVQPVLPPPERAEEDDEVQQEAAAAAQFAAIPAGAPVSVWLPYTRDDQPDDRRNEAITRVLARDGYAAELAALMTSDSTTEVCDALRLVAQLPPQPALVAAVAAAGRDLAGGMRFANGIPAAQDPGYERMAIIGERFSAWVAAATALRANAGADLSPELGEILRLSREREDSHVMQQDVRRVASALLQQWAGVAPLPGDPKP